MAPHADVDVQPSATPIAKQITSTMAAPFLQRMKSSSQSPSCTMLRVEGSRILNERNEHIVLKVTGFSGHEHEHRAALAAVLGKKKAKFFFDKLLEYFFTESDAEFFASLGLNCIRIPFNYRHFIDDENPYKIKQEGFDMLDRLVNICGKYNLYVILDLHAVPGGQNQDWHSDSGTAKAMFWEHRVLQDQIVDLWVAIAKHFARNPVIAGYNPLNEPADPQHRRLVAFYERVERAIRAVDPDHILWIDGNTYAMDFTHFPEKTLPNSVYACHDYAMQGFPVPGIAPYNGSQEHKDKLRKQFERKVAYMRKKGVPIWNGEFGPVYANERTEKNALQTNDARIAMLQEQLKIYRDSEVSWSIWLYKDIGYQGMTYVDPDSPYMKLIAVFLKKKQQCGLDFWGCVDKTGVEHIYKPFIEGLKAQIPDQFRQRKYPNIWNFDRHVERVVRECLMSEYLGWEFAELFREKTEEELDQLAASFKFENCVKRQRLNETLRMDAEQEKP